MQIHNVAQGSPEWHALRSSHFCSSEAPAMIGASPYVKRDELLAEKATGILREIDEATARRFADGHRAEAAYRKHAEATIGDDLYPITATAEINGMRLLASMDGITMDREVGFEHKLISKTIITHIDQHGEPPAYCCWQMEHQMVVTGAKRILFVASDGTPNNKRECWYESKAERRAQLLAGWAQFAEDLARYTPAPQADPAPIGRSPETLPALRIEVAGHVTASNLHEFKAVAMQVIRSINRDLRDDQDFADAEQAIKWCESVEDRLDAAKQHALAQTASIDELFRTIDDISAEARRVRLELAKLLSARKTAIRSEIVTEAITKLAAHTAALNDRIGRPYMPDVPADFHAAIKGKKTLASLRGAVDAELTRAKLAANEIADRIQINLKWLNERTDKYTGLFPDIATLVLKDAESMQAIALKRIAEHEQAEARRIEEERARIRAEEEAKLRAGQAAAAPAPQPPAPGMPVPAAAAPVAGHEAEPASITIDEINARLGFVMTADFIEATLGIAPTSVESTKMYRPSDFRRICAALIAHIQGRMD